MQVHSVEAIFRALNDRRVQYLVVGGLAVNAHGFLRFTNDVDLVIHLEPSNILEGLRALENLGYLPRLPVGANELASLETRERWRKEKNMIVLQLWSEQHQATPVDIFLAEPFPFATEYSQASQLEVAPGLWVPFVSKATLVKMKEEAGRSQDLEDLRRLKML